MARTSLRALLCAALLLASRPASAGDGPDQRQKVLRAVQVALEQGQELVQKGDYAAAVAVLEKQVPYIDGNKRYLALLRDAYRGQVTALEKAGDASGAKKYRGFLEILEPTPRAAVATPGTAAPVHRGKVEDDDPFAATNAAGKRGQTLLTKAERAYEERAYEAAARWYAQAERAEPGCAQASQERWAYCRLFTVAQELNRASGTRSVSELEQEVKQALRMAPRLERFGQGLLARMKDTGDAGEPAVSLGAASPQTPVEVKHTPRGETGWAVAETANVRVFHALSQDKAEKAVRVAEATRVNMTRKWFGEAAKGWSPRCDIYIHANGQAYASKTGAPAGSPGHSTISLDGGRVVVRRVDIRGDDPNFLVGVLPHETTHVVLAGRFGTHHVPRWADEGMAVLSEPRERVELHLRNLPTHKRDGALFGMAELMKMADYPEPRRVGAFYAQSVSLVDFLCKKKDAATFARFLREGLDGRYETALERHYGYRSFADLEQEWHGHAFGEGSVVTVAEKRREPYSGTTP
jgi:hypothetical protein